MSEPTPERFPDDHPEPADPQVPDPAEEDVNPPPPAGDELPEPAEPIPSKPPRPGLPLAVAMMFGVVLIHLVATSAYVLVVHPDLTQAQEGDDARPIMERLAPEELFRLLAFEQVMFVITVFALTWWFFGKRFSRVIPFRLPPMRHVGLIVLLVLPLAVMDGFLAQMTMELWEAAFGESPSQGDLPLVLDGVTQHASLATLLLILAVMPALGEELVFRGVIGRGLTARKGLIAGVLWTSLLFSLVHGNLVQGVGVFFVGVMCHVTYLATRTMLAPILLHFLNNSLPVMALKQAAEQKAEGAAEAVPMVTSIHPLMALAAAVCVVSIAVMIWKSRVQFLDAEGADLIDEYPTAEVPPEADHHRCPPIPGSWATVAGVSYFLFLLSTALIMPA